ncbi:colanic acid biosynthesis glycosyl transferase WcaI [Cnuella takakiae]|uniref:Colanic acid biosynthesis glycosyl transferase WcaI n=1 Tax=Cnuella takakiae TaxID=1302690 RepID=A0A1M5E2W1_9BACT|nr:WcaI family glycosyltransferase [Cnuella takakiae]OLY93798.1 glycosyl transferase [Cnuella takakiae]SHF73412.1 colanic acid biosynthesis glycosyl transferase WcaI [Cnuella takakiae]
MRKPRILLIGGNYFPEPTGIGKYNAEMLDWLASQGHECAVVTTYPYYPFWKVQEPYGLGASWFRREERISEGEKIKVYRCPHYVSRQPSGMKRILSDLSFFISAFLQLLVLLFGKRYDYVITVVPPFQLGLLGVLYKWVRKATLIFHVQDLQIDAAKELGMIKSRWLLNIMFAIERFILHRADHVSSISNGMMQRIEEKCSKPILFFPNWVDTEFFFPIPNKELLKKEFGFSPKDKIILYSGAVGEKQGLESIIQIAGQVNGPHLQFVICGTGPYKEKLKAMAADAGLSNVHFMPVQPKERFNEFLNMADVHLVLQKAKADDLVMPSKLTSILSVGGLALVTASANSSLHSLVSQNGIGVAIEPENGQALVDAIHQLIEHPYEKVKQHARLYAEEFLTMNRIMHRYFTQVQLIASPEKERVVLVARDQLELN